jgi:general secretion pathway protein G
MNIPIFFRTPRRRQRGFTLIEMLIVLSIIGLLMGMVIYHLTGINDVAQKQKVQADILTLREALTTYQLDGGMLPTTEQGLKALLSRPTVEPIPSHWHAIMDQEVKDPWGNSYQYVNPGKHNPTRYDLYSDGPDGQPNTDDDIGNWPDTSK